METAALTHKQEPDSPVKSKAIKYHDPLIPYLTGEAMRAKTARIAGGPGLGAWWDVLNPIKAGQFLAEKVARPAVQKGKEVISALPPVKALQET